VHGAGIESSKRAATVASQGLSGKYRLNQGFVEETTVKATLLPAALCLGLAGLGTAAHGGEISSIVIDTDRSVNCLTPETIAADVCKGCKTDQEKAVALYDYLIRTTYMAYSADQPREMIGGRLRRLEQPMKIINVYGAAGCGRQAIVFCTVAKAAGIPGRLFDPDFAHTSCELQWDGKWHWLDVWLPAYFMDEKGGIYSYSELLEDKSRVTKAIESGRIPDNYMYYPKEDLKSIMAAKKMKSWGDGAVKVAYRENLKLRPGESCTWLWDNVGKWYSPGEKFPGGPAFKFTRDKHCKKAFPHWEPYKKLIKDGCHKWSDVYYRYYGNALCVTAPPLTRRALDDLGAEVRGLTFAQGGLRGDGGSLEIGFELPYVIADTEIDGAGKGSLSFEYSLDGGKTWLAGKKLAAEGTWTTFSLGKPNAMEHPADSTTGKYGYRLRVTLSGGATLSSLKVTNTTMLNFYSRPWLEPGDNNVTVAAEGAEALAATPLEITWQWVENWQDGGGQAKSYTHRVDKSGSKSTISVAGSKRPKMKSVTIACPAR